MTVFTAWQVKDGIGGLIANLFKNGDCAINDTVWHGPDGSYFIGDIADADGYDDDDFPEYLDAGIVKEYLD